MTEASQPMPIVYRIDRRGALERSEHPSLNPAPFLSNSWCAGVRESGGTVIVSNLPGTGCVFTVELPRLTTDGTVPTRPPLARDP